mmetsp:Transcript_37433/g.149356  ORF Transcript_37433/g.149356 Transcript_37433/m.149356 type:complete len:102 (-) Transcript_37433:104-409(-)
MVVVKEVCADSPTLIYEIRPRRHRFKIPATLLVTMSENPHGTAPATTDSMLDVFRTSPIMKPSIVAFCAKSCSRGKRFRMKATVRQTNQTTWNSKKNWIDA